MKAVVIIVALAGILFLLYRCQSKSRKMFLANLLRQVVYLIPRYFA